MNSFVIGSLMAAAVLLVWLYLALARGRFWLMRQRAGRAIAAPAAWPSVVAVVPARDEAECIAQSITSLLRQDYPGPFAVVLVDDQSHDRTAERAVAAAVAIGQGDRLTVLRGAALPAGWTGKVWAQQQGVSHAQSLPEPPDYLLMTDADIVHAADTVWWLAAQAERNGLVLVSLMARLRCDSVAERLLIPAFIYFFAMLYPFAWVNDRSRRTAAAAGGCMLVHRSALVEAGGIAAIRGALIDDCALARVLKRIGPIWLGLADRVRSIRAYPGLADVARMIQRSAYAQLGYSPVMLALTVLAMTAVFVLPAGFALAGSGLAQLLGATAWLLMALLFQPTLRFYGLSPLYGLLMPLIALLFILFTCNSALQYARGRGGQWKGRAQANLARTP